MATVMVSRCFNCPLVFWQVQLIASAGNNNFGWCVMSAGRGQQLITQQVRLKPLQEVECKHFTIHKTTCIHYKCSKTKHGNVIGSQHRYVWFSLSDSAKLLIARMEMRSSGVWFFPDYVRVIIKPASSWRTDLNHAAPHHSANVLSPLRHPRVQLIQIRGKGQNMWPEIIWNGQKSG